jgi:hypothetical protein
LLLSTTKVISNEVCASIGCQRISTKTINFQIGFSANVCSQCADDLIRDGIGIASDKTETKKGLALEAAPNSSTEVQSLSSKRLINEDDND